MAVRDVVQAAAGVGGGDNLYVEDVFSTYLYTGNGSTQTIENGIALGDGNYGPSVEFDGTNDYFSRSSEMTGNADGKTFTFSAWIYETSGNSKIYHIDNGSGGTRFQISFDGTGASSKLEVTGTNASGTTILNINSLNGNLALYTWQHILVSIDLTNSSNRHIYINGVSQTVTWNTYSNDNIDFTSASYLTVGAALYSGGSYGPVKGRLSHVFLDYTYRDLSVEANRRLFITADGQPATGLASLSPILYMPLDGSTASVGTNSGTGGDFIVNGSPTVLTQGGPYIESGYGQGGLVWAKRRDSGTALHTLIDTVRGVNKQLFSSSTASEYSYPNTITAFNSNGFTLGSDTSTEFINANNALMASWTFRKAPKFFDVVTWLGDGSAPKVINHSLAQDVGMIIVKSTSAADNWYVWHRSLPNSATGYLKLNTTNSHLASGTSWFTATSTNFTIVDNSANSNGVSYVAYLFAHNAGGFGDDGEQNVISCGSYTGNGSATGPVIDLGYEPQWLLIKRTDNARAWYLLDNMRGLATGSSGDVFFEIDTSAAESSSSNAYVGLTPTGFSLETTAAGFNASGGTYIYIAIRRPMKTPESGTEVFNVQTSTGSGWPGSPTELVTNIGFPADLSFGGRRTSWIPLWASRLQGDEKYLISDRTSAEGSSAQGYIAEWDHQNSLYVGDLGGLNDSGASNIHWNFRRAPGFMDVVAYTGTGVAKTEAHNLGVVPELIIVKSRSKSTDWSVYSKSLASAQYLVFRNPAADTNDAVFGFGYPSATTFNVDRADNSNFSGHTYIAYLFASLDGVSKVGNYSGTGADLNVDCGFSAGARFVLIKRTDSTGDWYVWDSVRGIVSGNDPYLLLNSTAAEVTSTDYIDPLASGFTVTSSAPAALNASGGSYIFLAIA